MIAHIVLFLATVAPDSDSKSTPLFVHRWVSPQDDKVLEGRAEGEATARPLQPLGDGIWLYLAPWHHGDGPALQVSEPGETAKNRVVAKEVDGQVQLSVDGALVTAYVHNDGLRPYFYPLVGPFGSSMVRHYPMKEVEGENRDHPHHRSLWFTHGDVNGHDFWHGGQKRASIRLTSIEDLRSGPVFASFVARHDWIGPEGETVCTDRRMARLIPLPQGFLMEWDLEVIASHGPLVFGDTKEGSMAIRLAKTLRLKGPVAAGQALNSEGIRGRDVWGKRADWVDYWGPVEGRTVGVAMFDHPGNPRHPTWWHARDYGLVAANPFGVHDFERKPDGTGDLALAKGQSLRLRYAVYVHKGDGEQAKVSQMYQSWGLR